MTEPDPGILREDQDCSMYRSTADAHTVLPGDPACSLSVISIRDAGGRVDGRGPVAALPSPRPPAGCYRPQIA
jgi:hypothetical protein